MAKRCVNERNECLSVMRNAEVLQLEVAGCLIVAVGLRRKVVCADRHPAVREACSIGGVKQFMQYAFAVLLAERHKRGPAKFIEAGAEALHGWCRTAFSAAPCSRNIQIEHVPAERRLEELTLLPRPRLRGRDERNSIIRHRLRRG